MKVRRVYKTVEPISEGVYASFHPHSDVEREFWIRRVTRVADCTPFIPVTDHLDPFHVERVYTEGGVILEGLGGNVFETPPPLVDPCQTHVCEAFMAYRVLSVMDAGRLSTHVYTNAFKIALPRMDGSCESTAAEGKYSLEYCRGETTRPAQPSIGLFLYLSPEGVRGAIQGFEHSTILAGVALAPVMKPPVIPFPSEENLDRFYGLKSGVHYLPPDIEPVYTTDEFHVTRELTFDEFLEEYARWSLYASYSLTPMTY